MVGRVIWSHHSDHLSLAHIASWQDRSPEEAIEAVEALALFPNVPNCKHCITLLYHKWLFLQRARGDAGSEEIKSSQMFKNAPNLFRISPKMFRIFSKISEVPKCLEEIIKVVEAQMFPDVQECSQMFRRDHRSSQDPGRVPKWKFQSRDPWRGPVEAVN